MLQENRICIWSFCFCSVTEGQFSRGDVIIIYSAGQKKLRNNKVGCRGFLPGNWTQEIFDGWWGETRLGWDPTTGMFLLRFELFCDSRQFNLAHYQFTLSEVGVPAEASKKSDGPEMSWEGYTVVKTKMKQVDIFLKTVQNVFTIPVLEVYICYVTAISFRQRGHIFR